MMPERGFGGDAYGRCGTYLSNEAFWLGRSVLCLSTRLLSLKCCSLSVVSCLGMMYEHSLGRVALSQ